MESGPDARLDGEMVRHRDHLVVKWMGEQYAARLDHLEALLDRRTMTTRNLVERLCETGHVRARHILVGEPTWVTPTQKGLDMCGLPYRERMPRSMRLSHVAAINDVRLRVHRHMPDAPWTSERQLTYEGKMARHMPDGIVTHKGRSAALTVEPSVRSIKLVKARLEKLEPHFDFVYVFCAPGALRKLQALEQTGEWPKLLVRDLTAPDGKRS